MKMTDADECNIKVVCRVRPMNEGEIASGSSVCVKFVSDESVQLGVSGLFIVLFTSLF